MALAITALTSQADDVDRSVYTSASISPTANRWLVADFFNRRGSNATEPTVAGLSLSWTNEASGPDVTGTPFMRVTRSYAWTGASPGSGTITFTLGGAHTAALWHVYEISGADTSDPFVQSVLGTTAGNGTSITITLASFTDSGNRPLICSGRNSIDNNVVDSTPSTYTELGDVTCTSPATTFATHWNPTDTDTTPSMSWATSSPRLGIASEVAILPAGGGGGVMDPLGMSGFFGA